MAYGNSHSQHLRQRLPHALLLPFPETGHINPLMQLARFLASNGCLISFVNTQHNHDLILNSNAAHLPSDAALPIQLLAIPDGLSDTDNRDTDVSNMFHAIHHNATGVLGPLISDINQQRSPHPITCIISDYCAIAGTLEVANHFGIPRVVFCPPAAASHVLICHAVRAAAKGTFPSKGVSETVIQYPGLPPMPRSLLPWMVGTGDQADAVFEGLKRNLDSLGESDWMLCNTVEEMEKGIVEQMPEGFPKVCAVGPLFLRKELEYEGGGMAKMRTGLWEEETECLKWLDAQAERSMLYVSLGSVATISGEQMREMAHGLEDSGVPILWALRPGTLATTSTIKNNDGSNGRPEFDEEEWTEASIENLRRRNINGSVDAKRSKMMISNWVPQISVLSHPSIAGFLTHGGWNSTLEALAMGVPLLSWPQLTDQFLNARLLESQWRVAVPLFAPPTPSPGANTDSHHHGLLDRFAIQKRVQEFMALAGDLSVGSIRYNADQYRQTIRRACSDGGSSDRNVGRFLEWMKRTAVNRNGETRGVIETEP